MDTELVRGTPELNGVDDIDNFQPDQHHLGYFLGWLVLRLLDGHYKLEPPKANSTAAMHLLGIAAMHLLGIAALHLLGIASVSDQRDFFNYGC